MLPVELALPVCAAMETGLQRLQHQSQEEYARLRQLHAKVICIQLSQLAFPLYILFAKEIQVFSRYEGEIAVTVHADATTLYLLREGASLTELIKTDKLRLDGDLSALQSFSQYLQQVRFDFAEPLSRYLGDVPTHMLMTSARRAREGALTLMSKTRSHLAQLTTQEYRLAPGRMEYLHYCDRLDELVAGSDAIEARISRLNAKLRGKFSS
jgi:ubiquinone biosynthesis accessory factor UbiJ